jgi:CheY-like chemotaxis protein
VTDTGIGIPEAKRERLFERFSQVDSSHSRQYGGTGLGLAISKKLVELMGGTIGVESEVDRGTTVWFSVTLSTTAAEDAVALPEQISLSETQDLRRGRILLAEDVEINREIARSMLEKAGYEVEVVSDGAEAVEALQHRRHDPVLMDVQMPVMDGIQATQHIRSLSGPVCRVPIIAMTADVYAEQIATFRHAGMDDHIGKPFKREELLETIERWLSPSASEPERSLEATAFPDRHSQRPVSGDPDALLTTVEYSDLR